MKLRILFLVLIVILVGTWIITDRTLVEPESLPIVPPEMVADGNPAEEAESEPSEEESVVVAEAVPTFSREPDEDGTIVLAEYVIIAGELGNVRQNTHGDVNLRYRDADHEHTALWQLVRNVFGKYIPNINEFHVFSDGVDETLAYVEVDAEDLPQWIVGIDPADVYTEDGSLRNKREFVGTLVHELAHVVTTDASQVEYDPELIAIEDDEELSERLYELEELCGRYTTTEGCTKPNSYLSLFFNEFWAGDRYNEMPYDDEELVEFYEDYQDEFVTEYAATNPEEDIAESFMFFVFEDRRTELEFIFDEKVDFFYQFPELVTLRDQIRAQISDIL